MFPKSFVDRTSCGLKWSQSRCRERQHPIAIGCIRSHRINSIGLTQDLCIFAGLLRLYSDVQGPASDTATSSHRPELLLPLMFSIHQVCVYTRHSASVPRSMSTGLLQKYWYHKELPRHKMCLLVGSVGSVGACNSVAMPSTKRKVLRWCEEPRE